MNKRLYYAIITPLFIVALMFPSSILYVFAVVSLVAIYFSWIEFKGKLKKAEGEQEIQQAVVPVILLMLFVALAITSTHSSFN